MLKPTYFVWNKEEPMEHWKEHIFVSIYKRRITFLNYVQNFIHFFFMKHNYV